MRTTRGCVLILILLASTPHATNGALVCVSHASHPIPVCEEVSVPGLYPFQVGDHMFQVRVGFTGGVYCTGAGKCGPGDCQEGEATAWWARMTPLTAFDEWWQVDIELPGQICDCDLNTLAPCVPPTCEMLTTCGDETFTVRMRDHVSHTIHFGMLGAAQVPNRSTTLPLHAVVTGYGPCQIPDPCSPGPPTVKVSSFTSIAAYLLVSGYENVPGIQTAFDWGDWTFLNGIWDCQAFQITAIVPTPPGGPQAGTLQTAFNCITGGTTQIIGRMHMITSNTGCLEQVESAEPFGTHVIDCTQLLTAPILPQHRGSICVNTSGVNACPGAVAVEGATWGHIKAYFR